MREDEAAENGRHERVSPCLDKFVNPELKAAVKSKCGSENFVLSEDQEKNAHADAQKGESIAVASGGA
jgi:hypothetical protein